jgi:predicted CXXCH cytochrome family protein
MIRTPLPLAILVGLAVFGTGLSLAQSPPDVPRYVGSQACTDCHGAISDAWSKSHHALAWQTPDASNVIGDFNDARVEHNGITSRFFRRGDEFVVETDGPDGKLKDYEVKSIAGIEPLQQYLLEVEPGRLQALDLSWDATANRWYHLYPDQDLKGGNGLHWTGPYKNWSARCAECHATGFEKNYRPQTRSYASTQAEIGVGCEACHGPGEAHLAWAEEPEAYAAKSQSRLSDKGLTIAFTPNEAQTEIQQCAGCHSRRGPFGDQSPVPGTPFHDAYRLALLRDGLYHADGTIQDEVYVYGSFLQSKMHKKGVRCSDCHDPHQADLKASGNGVCTQCHSPAGNTRFPTLKKASYDDPTHHFHDPGSAGAQCKSCHMIERVYMGIDGRRDHSFRVPRPDLSDETGAPNACTDCHNDKKAAWAAAELERRFPDSKHRGPHFSQVFAAARRDPTTQIDKLIELALDAKLPAIVRASALDLLRSAGPETATRAERLLRHPDPLIRAAAIDLQTSMPMPERLRRLEPLLNDQTKLVRIAAARALIGVPRSLIKRSVGPALQAASTEWQKSLMAKADFPESHMAIGGSALALRNPRAALQAFGEAVRQDPQLIDAWIMLARIRLLLRDRDGARDVLKKGLVKNPENQFIQSMLKQL